MREFTPAILMSLIFLSVYLLSITLADKFEVAGVKAFERPNDPTNIIYFFVILIVITLIILLAKIWMKEMVQILILLAVAATIFTFFQAILFGILAEPYLTVESLSLSALITSLLLIYPEWYVIDLSAILLSVGAITIFGISLSIPLVLILLILLALYDATSVYKTKHMIDLADTVVDLKLPILFVMPHKLNYKFRRQIGGIKKQIKRKERDAFFVGVGDVVMPGILVVSSYHFSGYVSISLSIIAGILVSFLILMVFVSRGKPHAGLPFLNTGAIGGYLLSSLTLYGHLVGFSI